MTQANFSDEELMAYVDGELDQARSREIEDALETTPELAARLEQFDLTRKAVDSAYREVLDEPVPDHLKAAVYQTNAGDNIVPFKSSPSRKKILMSTAMAASVTLTLGILIGYQINPTATLDQHSIFLADAGDIQPLNPLHQALDTTPTHDHFGDIAQKEMITPVLSFRSRDGRYCREFEIHADKQMSLGIACRNEQHWRVEILLAADANPIASGYQPAAGFNEGALNIVLDKLWQEDITPAQEQQLIDSDWH